jgi:undecaprenyl diphosphate synthase
MASQAIATPLVQPISDDRHGPKHVAIIMDGNGRWAQQRNLPRLAGHRAGVENIRRIVTACAEFNVEVLTLYAFSTENWGRPADEVSGILELFYRASRPEVKRLHAANVKIRHIGRMDRLPRQMQQRIIDAQELTRLNQRMTLNLAFNYGGRAEIVDAVRSIIREGLNPDYVDEKVLSDHLYTSGQPDPDLLIRTAGEMRLSNFLIWQASYAEYYATPKFWPEFDGNDLQVAIEAFAGRHRKFGRL